MQDWFNANEHFISLDDMMCRHRIFRLLKNNDDVLSDARELTGQFSLFRTEDSRMGEHDFEVLHQITEYENCITVPERGRALPMTILSVLSPLTTSTPCAVYSGRPTEIVLSIVGLFPPLKTAGKAKPKHLSEDCTVVEYTF